MSLWKAPCATDATAPPTAFRVHSGVGPNCILKKLILWTSSKLQLPSHASRFVVFPSSHCSDPVRIPSPHTEGPPEEEAAADDTAAAEEAADDDEEDAEDA